MFDYSNVWMNEVSMISQSAPINESGTLQIGDQLTDFGRQIRNGRYGSVGYGQKKWLGIQDSNL